MASSNPPIKGVAYTTRIFLRDFANPGSWKNSPTIAAGDFKVDIDGGGFNNPATLPSVSPASGESVLVTLSTSEMNGDVITLKWIDQTSPKEWADGGLVINTTGAAAAANVTQWNGTTVATPATAGIPDVNVKNAGNTAWASGAITAASIAADAIGASELAADAVTEIATAVWASATRTLTALGFTLGASDLASDTITAAKIAADAITAAKIATDAIDADALKTDAITEIVTAVLTTAMTEAYNADGAAPTLAQALFLIMQVLTEFAISGTTLTVNKLDGTTEAATFTLDSSTSPTSLTRAS